MPKNTRNEDKSDIEKELEEALREEGPQEEKRLPEETEFEKELENEIKSEKEPSPFAERFYELSGKTFKTETELDTAINGILNEIERDYFFRGLLKTKKPGKLLLKKGREIFQGATAYQSAKDITQLTRSNLKGTLSPLAKAALKGVQEGAAVPPVLGAIGFEPSLGAEKNRQAWRNFAILCEESFDYLAVNLNENADDPMEASRLAFKAFGAALKKVESERKSATTQREKGVREEPSQRKVIGRTVPIILGLVCIILSASLITVLALYLPAANTINSLNAEITGLQGNITSLTQQISVLQSTYSQINTQLTDKDAQIADLNQAIQTYQSLLFLNETGVLAGNQVFQVGPNTNVTIWSDLVEYAGYVTVDVQSSSNTTYAQVVYTTLYGVNYDEAVVVGISGATAFPVLPGTIEVRIGNTESVDSVNGTVTAIYHY